MAAVRGRAAWCYSGPRDDSWTRDDWRTVLLHVQAQAIRHPDFARAVHQHVGVAVAAELVPDDIQAERQRTYQNTRVWMSRARFAVLRHQSRPIAS